MTNTKLRAIGLNSFFENQLASFDLKSVIVARVSAHHGSQVVMYGETGEFRVHVQSAEADGKVAVGDWLVLNATDNRLPVQILRHAIAALRTEVA